METKPRAGARATPFRGRMAALFLLTSAATYAMQDGKEAPDKSAAASLDVTRATMSKWIETQQIIARERKDWQQGKEILADRLDLVKQEVASLEEKLKQAQSSVDAAEKKKSDLLAENEQIKAVGAQLTEAVSAMETEARKLLQLAPVPVQAAVEKLVQRMPTDPKEAHVVLAERFQNVIGILNELNKANNEITVSYEVHELADGKPSEVRAIYVGLAQAWYVSARGEAGIGKPGPEGWEWEPSKEISEDVLVALEILQGKHSPEFVPLPVSLR